MARDNRMNLDPRKATGIMKSNEERINGMDLDRDTRTMKIRDGDIEQALDMRSDIKAKHRFQPIGMNLDPRKATGIMESNEERINRMDFGPTWAERYAAHKEQLGDLTFTPMDAKDRTSMYNDTEDDLEF